MRSCSEIEQNDVSCSYYEHGQQGRFPYIKPTSGDR